MSYDAQFVANLDEIDVLRARLAEVEAERDAARDDYDRRLARDLSDISTECGNLRLRAEAAETRLAAVDEWAHKDLLIANLRARLAAVEAERNAIATHADAMLSRAQRAEARLAEVEARCTQFLERTDVEWIRERQIVENIRAIARGEGDR